MPLRPSLLEEKTSLNLNGLLCRPFELNKMLLSILTKPSDTQPKTEKSLERNIGVTFVSVGSRYSSWSPPSWYQTAQLSPFPSSWFIKSWAKYNCCFKSLNCLVACYMTIDKQNNLFYKSWTVHSLPQSTFYSCEGIHSQNLVLSEGMNQLVG